MSPSLVIIAALPREIAGLVRGTKADTQMLRQGIHLYRLPEAVVATGGMGSHRAALAFEAAMREAPQGNVISTGLAGACGPELRAGQVAEASVVIEARTGERFRTAGSQGANIILVTTDSIASVHEKARLAAAYGAAMVDMEAATIARLALARGLAFRAIKAISDDHDFELASLARFAGRRGEFRTGAFALHTAMRPHHWPKAIHLGRASARALTHLHERLGEVLLAERPR